MLSKVFDLVLMVDKLSFEVNLSSFDKVDDGGKDGSFIRREGELDFPFEIWFFAEVYDESRDGLVMVGTEEVEFITDRNFASLLGFGELSLECDCDDLVRILLWR